MIEIEFDPAAPLARCQGEPKTANAALQDYYAMSSGRSLQALFLEYRNRKATDPLLMPPTLRRSTLGGWSLKYDWQRRITAQEDIDRAQLAAEKSAALKEEAEKWASRQIQVRNRDWDQAEAVRGLVDQILEATPSYIKRSQKTIQGKDGSPDRIIIKEQLDIKLLLTGLKNASYLQRLAAEMETDHLLNENTTPEDLEEIRRKRWQATMEQLNELNSTPADENTDPTLGDDESGDGEDPDSEDPDSEVI